MIRPASHFPPLTVRDRRSGDRGAVLGLTSEQRPIVDWADGPTQSRSWADLEVVS